MTRRLDLPTGTVTFLFTDIEGSTRLIEKLGERRYVAALSQHRATLREAFTAHGGVEVDNQGDAFFYAFPEPTAAVAAAVEAQGTLAAGPVSVRMGLHTGEPRLTPEGYAGREIHRAARIAAAAHGGQVVLSRETRSLLDDRFELLDLGEHRVKDFGEPVWIYQLGTERFPPLKTISNTNLPRPASSFVGREREVAEIGALLQDGARLVTLTGPGGTGKTRLAIESAAEVVPAFRNGVFWVGLAALRDPALVPETIGQTIGAKDGLAEHVGEREMLLLLDNLEQVVESAPELAGLVEACPNLRLLVTSRERLRVRGESEYPVSPLDDVEAVRLFTERSQLLADETIAELCRRLDDLPLAIELAAARTSVLSPAQILERLSTRLDLLKGGRDTEARQATLRATIAWSHDLLTPDEQRLFARLSVFRGGWTLDAAEAIADADLDVLQSLVDKSLVRRTGERFAMLETIREFASERLAAAGEAADLRSRHAQFFLALAEEAHPQIPRDPQHWLHRMEVEHDNFRAAIERATEAGDAELPARLCGELWPFWYLSDHVPEARRRLGEALSRYDAPDIVRAKALNGAMAMAAEVGDTSGARLLAHEALAIHERLGGPWSVANSRFLLAQLSADEGDWVTGRDMLEESVEAFVELGDSHFSMLARRTLAWMYEELGDIDRVRTLTQENYREARATGNKRMEARAQASLAGFVVKEGRVAEGLAMYQSSLRLDREVGDQQGRRLDLFDIAEALSIAGELEPAAVILAGTEAWRERSGVALESWLERMNSATLERLHAGLSDGEFDAAWRRGAAMTEEQLEAFALGVEVQTDDAS